MTTDIYAVYDEQTGDILHVHAAPDQDGRPPHHVMDMLDPGHQRPLRLLRLPPEGLTAPSRVVDGELQEAPEGAGFGAAGVALTSQAPSQVMAEGSRTFQRQPGRAGN